MEPQPINTKTTLADTDVSDRTIAIMVSAMIILMLLLLLGLFLVLPNGTKIEKALAPEARWVILVALSGGLGAYVHMAHSFVTYVGLEKVKRSWLWWYAMRPFIGMALAISFFLVYGAASGKTEDLKIVDDNPGGILAIAVVVGMFSKQAIDKLADIFDAILKSETGEKMKDKDSYTNGKKPPENGEEQDEPNNIPEDPNAKG